MVTEDIKEGDIVFGVNESVGANLIFAFEIELIDYYFTKSDGVDVSVVTPVAGSVAYYTRPKPTGEAQERKWTIYHEEIHFNVETLFRGPLLAVREYEKLKLV